MQTDRQVAGWAQMGGREVYEDERTDDYASGWIDGWMDGQMTRQMGGWIDNRAKVRDPAPYSSYPLISSIA